MSQSRNDPSGTGKRQSLRWAETSAPLLQAVPATPDRDAGGALPVQHEHISTEDASLPRGSDEPGLPPLDTAPALAPGSRIGQYQIIRLLGRGGMGEVQHTRALVSMTELHALHRDAGLVDEIVQHLATMRLVVIERGAEGAERTVELVHESLISRWPTLVCWLGENQDDAAMLARLRGAARDWERGGRAAGLLWTGEAAAEARAWQQRYRGELAPAERRYLDAVLAAADRARRVRRRLFRGILSAAVVVAIAMAWLAWQQAQARQEATTLARQEAEARQAAAEAAVAAAQEAA